MVASYMLLKFKTVAILDIILRPVFYLKYDVSQTGFCLRFQVVLSQLGYYHRKQILALSIGRNRVVSLEDRQNPVSETHTHMYSIVIIFIAS
jgi:hypothetical protein